FASSGESRAFRWTQSDGMQDLGTLGGSVIPRAISANGAVIVGSVLTTENATHAFRWTEAGGMVDLGTFGSDSNFSDSTFITADGTVVVGVGSTDSREIHTFRWTEAAGMVD